MTHIWNWPESIEFILVHSTEQLFGKYSLLALWEGGPDRKVWRAWRPPPVPIRKAGRLLALPPHRNSDVVLPPCGTSVPVPC